MGGADIRAILYALVDLLPGPLLNGQRVRLGEFGSLRVSISSEACDSPGEVSARAIKSVRYIFHPGPLMKEQLEKATFIHLSNLDKSEEADAGE